MFQEVEERYPSTPDKSHYRTSAFWAKSTLPVTAFTRSKIETWLVTQSGSTTPFTLQPPKKRMLLDVPPCHKGSFQVEESGVGSSIRRYANGGEGDFTIDRLWLWNGTRIVRIRQEPPFYRHPELDLILTMLADVRSQKSQT